MIPLVLAVHVADLAATLAVVGAYGIAAEVNPLMSGALALGPLAALAAKCALLAVIFSAAAIGPRYRRLLLSGALVVGTLGAASGLAVLA
jgi:hypothetical protein